MKIDKEKVTTGKLLQEAEVAKRKMEYEKEGIPVGRLLYSHGLPVVAK